LLIVIACMAENLPLFGNSQRFREYRIFLSAS
jgi:hypothetical protein